MIARGPVPAGGAPTQVIPQAVWTGTEMVVWGGWGDPIAAAYEPATDTWRDLPPGPLSAREQHAVIAWDGRVVVLGGRAARARSAGTSSRRRRPRSGQRRVDDAAGTAGRRSVHGPRHRRRDGRRRAPVRRPRRDHGRVRAGPGSTAWRSLGSAGVNGFLEPVGVAGGQWLFVGSSDEGTTTAPRRPGEPDMASDGSSSWCVDARLDGRRRRNPPRCRRSPMVARARPAAGVGLGPNQLHLV